MGRPAEQDPRSSNARAANLGDDIALADNDIDLLVSSDTLQYAEVHEALQLAEPDLAQP